MKKENLNQTENVDEIINSINVNEVEEPETFYFFDLLGSRLYMSEEQMLTENGGYGEKHYHSITDGEKIYRIFAKYDNHCGRTNREFVYLDRPMTEEEFEKYAKSYKRKLKREIGYNPIYTSLEVCQEELTLTEYKEDGYVGKRLNIEDLNTLCFTIK